MTPAAGPVVTLTGHDLTLEEVARVAVHGARVALAPAGRAALEASRRVVEARIAAGERVYGVTTGFGRLAEVVIPPDQQVALQRNVIVSHAAGFGAPLSREAVRALMLLRANTLAHGHSGCTPRCVELLVDLLNHGIHPVVPEFGSVGASGDLVPLAHMALGMMGEGDAELDGRVVPARAALAARGLAPLDVREKDGLALSSRNAYLSPEERRTAMALSRALEAAANALRDGEKRGAALELILATEVGRALGARLQYAAAVDPDTLQPVATAEGPILLALAVYVGSTRLIDNLLTEGI